MKTLRNIISLLSLAAVASSPISGVLAPTHTGGCCVIKYFSGSFGLDTHSDTLQWEPVLPDDGPGNGSLPENLIFSAEALPHQVAWLKPVSPNPYSLPLYIVNQSLLFYDQVLI